VRIFAEGKNEVITLPRSGNQQAQSADSTPQLFNFFLREREKFLLEVIEVFKGFCFLAIG